MKYPLDFVELKSKFQRPVYLSFDIVLKDCIIQAHFTHIPSNDEPWLCHYESINHGSGLMPIEKVEAGPNATPENLAVKLCEKLHTSSFIKIERLKRNFVDLFIPSFVRIGPICPNYPEQKTDISRVIGFVLFADLRGFSTWCMHAEPEQISEVYEVLSDTVAEYIKDYQFDYWKLLGDGIMLVWEAGQDETQAANCAIAAAYDLHRKYWYYYKESPFRLPEGFGIAISGGYITKFKSPTFFESCVVSDYLGPIVNQAARLQVLAKPGEVLVNRYVAKTSKYDWYSFENITVHLKDKIDGLKGLSPYEKEVFKVKHKYFGSTWETFITDPS